jgi:hypothetical protein
MIGRFFGFGGGSDISSGTVTSFAFNNANGFAGSVATATTTPTLTLTVTTTQNYLIKTGAAGAISNSIIYDNGSGLGIDTTTISAKVSIFTANNTYALNMINTSSVALGFFLAPADAEIGTTSNHPILIFTNGAGAITIDTSQRTGFGTTLPTARIHAVGSGATSSTYSLKAENSSALIFSVRDDKAVSISGFLTVANTLTGSSGTPSLEGIDISLSNAVTGTANGALFGMQIAISQDSARDISGTDSFVVFRTQLNSSAAGLIPDAINYEIVSPSYGGATPTTHYGILARNQGVSGITNSYAIYIEAQSGSTNNYGFVSLAKRNGVFQAVPTAYLHLGAGTATASTSPLKFTSGTNNTTAEAGAMEYNGTNLFFTRTGTTRQTVLTANVVTTEVVVSDTTVTVNIAGTDYKLLARA